MNVLTPDVTVCATQRGTLGRSYARLINIAPSYVRSNEDTIAQLHVRKKDLQI